MGITSEQIMGAADELQRLGKAPALVAVREVLGTKGSFSTIAPTMAKWRARQAQAANAKVQIPAVFAARMKQQAEHAWADALGVAEEVVSSERDALRAARKELEADREEVAALLDQADGRLADAKAQREELEARISILSELVAAAKAELAGAHARLDERERVLTAERDERQSVQSFWQRRGSDCLEWRARIKSTLSQPHFPRTRHGRFELMGRLLRGYGDDPTRSHSDESIGWPPRLRCSKRQRRNVLAARRLNTSSDSASQ